MKHLVSSIVLAISLIAAYFMSYFALTESSFTTISLISGKSMLIREYRYHWMTTFYAPVENVEEAITGRPVLLQSNH